MEADVQDSHHVVRQATAEGSRDARTSSEPQEHGLREPGRDHEAPAEVQPERSERGVDNDISRAVWAELRNIEDPCSVAAGCPLSLVEMQIIRSVEVTESEVVVHVQPTEVSCMFSFHIAEEVERRLAILLEPTAKRPVVRVEHDFTTVWTEDDIEPAARERLVAFRNRRDLQ